MFQHDDVILVGVGHWSCSRNPQDLAYPFWSWRVSIDGVFLEDEEYINTGIGIHGKSGADKLIERLGHIYPSQFLKIFLIFLFMFPVITRSCIYVFRRCSIRRRSRGSQGILSVCVFKSGRDLESINIRPKRRLLSGGSFIYGMDEFKPRSYSEFGSFGLQICFGFRYSDFGFLLYT